MKKKKAIIKKKMTVSEARKRLAQLHREETELEDFIEVKSTSGKVYGDPFVKLD